MVTENDWEKWPHFPVTFSVTRSEGLGTVQQQLEAIMTQGPPEKPSGQTLSCFKVPQAAVILRPTETWPLGPRPPRAKGSMYMILILPKHCRWSQPHLFTAHPSVLV